MTANEEQVGGSHYKKSSIEHWDYALENEIPYLEAQAIKYVSRWRDKLGIQDLRKARHFLDKLIEYEKEHHREQDIERVEKFLKGAIQDLIKEHGVHPVVLSALGRVAEFIFTYSSPPTVLQAAAAAEEASASYVDQG